METKLLPVELNDEERAECVQQAHEKMKERKEVDAKLAMLSAQVKLEKARFEALEGDYAELIQDAATGEGIRQVEVKEVVEGGFAKVIRVDTDEVIDMWEAPQGVIPGVEVAPAAKPALVADSMLNLLSGELAGLGDLLVGKEWDPKECRKLLDKLVKDGEAISEGKGRGKQWALAPLAMLEGE